MDLHGIDRGQRVFRDFLALEAMELRVYQLHKIVTDIQVQTQKHLKADNVSCHIIRVMMSLQMTSTCTLGQYVANMLMSGYGSTGCTIFQIPHDTWCSRTVVGRLRSTRLNSHSRQGLVYSFLCAFGTIPTIDRHAMQKSLRDLEPGFDRFS